MSIDSLDINLSNNDSITEIGLDIIKKGVISLKKLINLKIDLKKY